MPKISVIVPVYNTAQYLPQCLDSIINQTFNDIEIICINDGSTDTSLEILNRYAIKDTRVKIIDQTNHGAGYSRNEGIKKASGEYIAFIDADDWIDEAFLEKSLNTAKEYDADIVETTKSYNVYSDNNVKLFNKKNAKGFTYEENYFRRDVIWDKLFKTEFIKKHDITFPNGLCHNDAFFLLQCLFFNAKTTLDNEAIYYHNKANETSIRFKPSDKKLLSQLDMFILEIEFMNSHFFTFYDYYHNYHKLLHTAKIKQRYIKDKENKVIYKNKLNQIKQLNKYPHTIFGIIKDFLTSSRFREELKYSKADSKEYPFLLKEWYKKKTKKELNLENPITFNEKI
ncbi:MAG: glycosyltransferase [Rhodospirillales bacterium]|nr:glycosyltransferase [Rhodospirillales bacterium]